MKGNILLTAAKFDLRKYLHSFIVFLFPVFISYSFKYGDLSNPLLRSFDNTYWSFADKSQKEHTILYL